MEKKFVVVGSGKLAVQIAEYLIAQLSLILRSLILLRLSLPAMTLA